MRKFALPIALVFGFAMIGCSDDDDNCVDVDGDGYGTGSDCMGPDCDDDDANVWEDMDGYGDVDMDGEHDTDPTTVCTDGTLPAEYAATAGTDCDDTDANAVAMVAAYVDADGDGYGEATETTACGDTDWLPPGFVDNGDDCDDGSPVLMLSFTGYPDSDGDTVASDVEETICGTTLAPAHFHDTAGTDCDDDDVMATSDASHGALCTIKGFCLDTEPILAFGMPDLGGIGACATTDCNGRDPTCKDPMVDQGTSCVVDGDCNTGEICKDFGAGSATCWATPACCNSNPAGYNCNTLALTCLTDCNELTDDAARITCLQFECYEQATPLAQQLYNVAQACAAENGCFILEDFVGCAMGLCNAEFVMGCLADNQ